VCYGSHYLTTNNANYFSGNQINDWKIWNSCFSFSTAYGTRLTLTEVLQEAASQILDSMTSRLGGQKTGCAGTVFTSCWKCIDRQKVITCVWRVTDCELSVSDDRSLTGESSGNTWTFAAMSVRFRLRLLAEVQGFLGKFNKFAAISWLNHDRGLVVV